MQTPEGWTCERGQGYTLFRAPAADLAASFAHQVAQGLSREPRTLPNAFLYDEVGSTLYEQITAQPEYYLTRAEDRLLQAHAEEIRAAAGDVTLVELGSGSSTKTRRLLDAGFTRYVAIDISGSALIDAATTLRRHYPDADLKAMCSTYADGLAQLPALHPLMLSFLGSSLCNLTAPEVDAFLERVQRALPPGSAFLLGVDKVKDPARLEAAYNDAAGFTARFTDNFFVRMPRELGIDIPAGSVKHVAFYNDRLERIEIYAEFQREVRFELLGQDFRIAKGERIRTEISRKYRPASLAAHAARFDLHLVETFEDEDFALVLLRRGDAVVPATVPDQTRTLQRVRRHTYDIVRALNETELTGQHSSLMSPIVWDLMHIACFEKLWLHTNLADQPGVIDPAFDPDLHPRATRCGLELPSSEEALAFLEEVRRGSLQPRSANTPLASRLLDQGFVYGLVAQHEAQHQETILQSVQLLRGRPIDPAFTSPLPPRPERTPHGMVEIPAGRFRMGTDDPHAYDNERPAHWVDLPGFRIDIAPVTNAAFIAFIEAGGYADPAWWTPEGWAWVQEESAAAPLAWERNGEHWGRCLFGRLVGLDPHRPVVHVSWYEADAYARWTGKRLPTEAEWEKAAGWDASRQRARTHPWGEEPAEGRANLGQRHLLTSPVGSWPQGTSFFGCHQMLGDVWEWCDTWFSPYPGFRAWPYPEYSEPFYDDTYRVLRGASFATRGVVARNTFRNWDYPQRRQIFAGFRCAQDL